MITKESNFEEKIMKILKHDVIDGDDDDNDDDDIFFNVWCHQTFVQELMIKHFSIFSFIFTVNNVLSPAFAISYMCIFPAVY